MNGPLSSNHTTEGVMDAPGGAQTGLADLPPSSWPWALAISEYTVELLNATLLGGDWAKAEAAYDRMLTEQIRLQAGFIAASSGAATELDYYYEGTD
jgi:hypothetical protein